MKTCPVCKYSDSLPFITVNKFTVVKCKNCDLAFTILPTSHDVNKYNTVHYAENYLAGYENRKERLVKRFMVRLKDIERHKRGGNLLDVGCSTGLFLRTVQENSIYQWKLFGIDINKNSIQFAQTKVNASFFCFSLHKKKFKKGFFDCITCFDVLEHDVDIKGNLKEIHRILKPGGLLVIQLPNYKSVMAYLCGQNWDWWSVPDHILHFSPSVLSKIVSENGFMVRRLFTWEPAKEFVKNIQGTIKMNVSHFMSLNKILSKLSVIPLCFLWFVLRLVEKEFDAGGLLVVHAVKK